MICDTVISFISIISSAMLHFNYLLLLQCIIYQLIYILIYYYSHVHFIIIASCWVSYYSLTSGVLQNMLTFTYININAL